MGEVPEGHEVLSDADRDQHLADYNASENVAVAHDIVAAEFAQHQEAEEKSGIVAERINDVKREMFFLNSEIDKQINLRPDAQRLGLRQERTEIFSRYATALEKFRANQAEDTQDFLDSMNVYKEELSTLLARLEGESDNTSQAQ